jgi:hypothetical protein
MFSPENKKNYNKKDELFNAVVELLEGRELFFPSASVANNEGKTVVGVLTDVLWHIDEHHEKINQQSTQCKDMPSVPSFFSAFRGFNDSVKKKKAARLNSSVLSQDVQNLYHIITFPAVQGEVWTIVTAAVKQLAECLHGYVEHLEAENVKQRARHSALEPVRSPLRNFDVREIEHVILVRGEYLALNSTIEEVGE